MVVGKQTELDYIRTRFRSNVAYGGYITLGNRIRNVIVYRVTNRCEPCKCIEYFPACVTLHVAICKPRHCIEISWEHIVQTN